MNKVTTLAAFICAALTTAAAGPAWAEDAKTLRLSIEGMKTGDHAGQLKTALGKVKGVGGVRVDSSQRLVEVRYSPTQTNPDEIVKAAKLGADLEAKVLRTTRLAIKGMVTPNCPVLVKAALGKVEGVKRVQASLETKDAEIEYLEGVTSPKAMRRVLKDKVGFDSDIVE